MACTDPHYVSLGKYADGKQFLIWRDNEFKGNFARDMSSINGEANLFAHHLPDNVFRLPCSKCESCRMYRSSHWAARCILEASMHEKNCFITLTYNEDNIHRCPNGSLNPDDLKHFWMRLRKKFPNAEISYFACGEYGAKYKRPHFHAVIFNFDFDDKYICKAKKYGDKEYYLWRSNTLEELWKYGYSIIGDCTYESAGYVARYTLKKQYHVDMSKYGGKLPEFTRVSNKRPIAKEWFLKHIDSIYGNVKKWYELHESGDGVPVGYFNKMDLVHLPNGRTVRPPKYFDDLLKKMYPEFAEAVINHRLDYIRSKDDVTEKRLDDLSNSMARRVKQLKRGFEEEDLEEIYHG